LPETSIKNSGQSAVGGPPSSLVVNTLIFICLHKLSTERIAKPVNGFIYYFDYQPASKCHPPQFPLSPDSAWLKKGKGHTGFNKAQRKYRAQVMMESRCKRSRKRVRI
jgi:hypothetical protein